MSQKKSKPKPSIRKPSKRKPSKKKTTKKKTTTKKAAAVKKQAAAKKTSGARKASPPKKNARRKTPASGTAAAAAFLPAARGGTSGRQSGDLQGLSNVAHADSESVDELLEEGNAFEADAVAGVEAADDADEKEVRTHEVPEDDVPGEYRDED